MTTACVGVHEGGEGREEGGDGRSMVRMYVCTPLYVRMYVPPPPPLFYFFCVRVFFSCFFVPARVVSKTRASTSASAPVVGGRRPGEGEGVGGCPTDRRGVRSTDGRTNGRRGGRRHRASRAPSRHSSSSFVRSFVRSFVVKARTPRRTRRLSFVRRSSFVVRRRSSSKHAHTPRIHTSSSSKDTS